jgi:hypothetical protein
LGSPLLPDSAGAVVSPDVGAAVLPSSELSPTVDDALTPVVRLVSDVSSVVPLSADALVALVGAVRVESPLPSSDGHPNAAELAKAKIFQERRTMPAASREAATASTGRIGYAPPARMVRSVSPFIAVLVLFGAGCAQHKDSARVVDPVLHAEGDELHREGLGREFKLGPYAIEKQRLQRRSVTPAEEIELELWLDAPGQRRWTMRCEAKRQRPALSDYAAVLDESDDAVAIACDLDDGGGSEWTFAAEGTLDKNFIGKLTPKRASIVGGALTVEVLMWRKRLNRVRRHLPQPVAQVKMGRAAIAAMVLARPEQAWVATDATPEFREVALATLAALNMLPLGLEG